MISKKNFYTFTILLTLTSLQNFDCSQRETPTAFSHQALRNMKGVLKETIDIAKNGPGHECVYAHLDKETQLFIYGFRKKTPLGLKESNMLLVPCYPIDLNSTILDVREQLANRYSEVGIKISSSYVKLHLKEKNNKELTKLNSSFNQKLVQDILKPLGSKTLQYTLGYPKMHFATTLDFIGKQPSLNYQNAQKNTNYINKTQKKLAKCRVSMYKEKDIRDLLRILGLDHTQAITKKFWRDEDDTCQQVKKYLAETYNKALFNGKTPFQLSEQAIILYVKQPTDQIPAQVDPQFEQLSIKTALKFQNKKPLLFSLVKHIKINVKTDDKNDIIKACKFLSQKKNIKELPTPIVPVHYTLYQVSKQIASQCHNAFHPAFVKFYGETKSHKMIRISRQVDDYEKTTIAKVFSAYKLTGLVWTMSYYLQLLKLSA